MDDPLALPRNLPAPIDDGAADHLVGMAVPALKFPATSAGSVNLREESLRRTVLYIFPMTARPGIEQPAGWNEIPGARGCTAESCAFRDHFAELAAAGASRVFGLSRQDSAYQSEVVNRLHLPFPLLSDEHGQLGIALNLPSFDVGNLTLYRRLTLVLRAGNIEHCFYPVFPADEHPKAVLAWLRGNPISELS